MVVDGSWSCNWIFLERENSVGERESYLQRSATEERELCRSQSAGVGEEEPREMKGQLSCANFLVTVSELLLRFPSVIFRFSAFLFAKTLLFFSVDISRNSLFFLFLLSFFFSPLFFSSVRPPPLFVIPPPSFVHAANG